MISALKKAIPLLIVFNLGCGTDNDSGVEEVAWISVPSGQVCTSYLKGECQDEHLVDIDGFEVMKYEVSKTVYANYSNGEEEEGITPRVRIDYQAALFMCEELGAALPTKEQWLYMAELNHGEEITTTDAWLLENSEGELHSEEHAKCGEMGICNLIGSVWEFVENDDPDYRLPDCEAGVVAMGGSHQTSVQEVGKDIEKRCIGVTEVKWDVGFRCVRAK